jgi:class 3 adenylate cyclase
MELDTGLQAELSRYLPVDLLDRLPERAALREAINHLTGLQAAVRSFLPLYIAEDEDLLERDYSALRAGSFLFADVSGFTALSEKLQQHSGAHGTETLTAVINDFFATMLEILAKSDGQLLKFAGDALLVFFPASDEGHDVSDALKAIRTGLRMQRAMRERFQPVRSEPLIAVLGSDHTAALTMSIGIARGRLFEALVGNPVQRDHLIQGDLPGLAMQAEAVGDRDEVIIDEALAQTVADHFRLTPLTDGFYQVVDDFGDRLDDYEFELLKRRRAKVGALFDLDTSSLLDDLAQLVRRVEVVSRYVAPYVLHDLVHSQDFHLKSENRFTVTMFCHVTGFAEMLRDWGDAQLQRTAGLLGRFYNIVQRIITAHGGTLARTDPYKLGTKYLVTFGAPIAHGDDPERAVAAAVEIMEQTRQFNQRLNDELPSDLRRDHYVSVRIGITQGETFAGEVGWKQRREFTVMGDDVNLSARFMANAQPDQILISARVQQRVAQRFELTEIPPLILKGKSKPIPAFIVEREQVEAAAPLASDQDLPFIGHDMFMLSLQMALRQAAQRRRRAAALVGDAGTGKTRIARQFARSAAAAGFTVAWANCHPRNDRKTTWASLIAQLFDIDLRRKASDAERRKLTAALDALDIGYLEPVLSELLFDLTAGTAHLAASPPPAPPAAASPTGDGDGDGQARRIADIFAAVQKMDLKEKQTSGFFGMMRRAAQAQSPAADGPTEESGIYRRVRERTHLADALAQTLKAYAEKHPTVLIIDDLHVDNPAALETLSQVLERTAQARLVIVVTYEPASALPLTIQEFPIPDLTRDETMHIAEALLRVSEIGPRLATLLWERTSGRPLFIESLLRTLLDHNFIALDSGIADLKLDADIDMLPENVRELVISRVDQLSADARQVLRAAAVLIEDFRLEALKALTGCADAVRLKTVLDELIRAQILEQRDETHYDFRHGMTQRVIYETLSRMERIKMHRMAASYLRELDFSVPRTRELAYHLSKCGLLPQAIEVIVDGAQHEEQRGALESAIELYSFALTLFPDEKSIQSELSRLQTQMQQPSG